MLTRADFSPQRWHALCDAPLFVSLAADAMYTPCDDLVPALAHAAAILATLDCQPSLLREILVRDELRAAQDRIRRMLGSTADPVSWRGIVQHHERQATHAALEALAALRADVDAYLLLLATVRERAARTRIIAPASRIAGRPRRASAVLA
jgi:hypothetical protein